MISESNTDDIFESIDSKIVSNIPKLIGKGLSWINDWVVDHTINISR